MDRRQALTAIAAGLAGCARRDGFTVGSKNFTEQVLLGEIVAQYLERRRQKPVDRKLDLGGTMLAHEALRSGRIDVYPEYTGTALTAILRLPLERDAREVYARVAHQYRRRWRLVWLPPLGFNNTFAMVIRGETARREGLRTLSYATRYRPGWKLGVGYEFLQRPDGLAALTRTYALPLAGQPQTMDLGLLYRALEQGQVTMVAGNSTDGLLSVLDVAALEDDRHAFPPYQAALVIRPRDGLHDALMGLSGRFSGSLMQQLNYAVDGRHERLRDVAARFLAKTA